MSTGDRLSPAGLRSRGSSTSRKRPRIRKAEATNKVCPVAWQHINLQERYEFEKRPDPLNIEAIIRELPKMPADQQTALAVLKVE